MRNIDIRNYSHALSNWYLWCLCLIYADCKGYMWTICWLHTYTRLGCLSFFGCQSVSGYSFSDITSHSPVCVYECEIGVGWYLRGSSAGRTPTTPNFNWIGRARFEAWSWSFLFISQIYNSQHYILKWESQYILFYY